VSGIIRTHFIQANAALDRRRLEELSLEAANRMTHIFPSNMGLSQFPRDRWKGHTFEEFWYSSEHSITYEFPKMHHHVPGSNLELRNDDSTLHGRVVWSIAAKPDSASSLMILGYPVIDGEALWSAEDWAMVGTELKYGGSPSNPDDYVAGDMFTQNRKISLGGMTNFIATNGRSMTGVLLFSIGAWLITESQIIVKAVGR
tara:strand:- start:162 stop:764 length:603 start_codon:yes stop_codon:yes gene_type:complete